VTTSLDHTPPEPHASIRMDARLDATTRAKLDEIATRFHQPRAAVLCHIMQWGLSREQIGPLDHGDSQGPVRHLYFYVASDLHSQVKKATTATGVKIAPWLRHMVRQIKITDFPASWQEERAPERSHDSRAYGKRFMLRLDDPSQIKLQQLIKHFGASKAKIIRQLIAQAESEDFPPSWHMRVKEPRARQARHVDAVHDEPT
jgi:predicted transcriptional regulator